MDMWMQNITQSEDDEKYRTKEDFKDDALEYVEDDAEVVDDTREDSKEDGKTEDVKEENLSQVLRRASYVSAMHVARLGLNDGTKLWISFKLFLKQTFLGSHDFQGQRINFIA